MARQPVISALLVVGIADSPLALLQLRQALRPVERFNRGERRIRRTQQPVSQTAQRRIESQQSHKFGLGLRAFVLRTLAVGDAQYLAVVIEVGAAHSERGT